MPSSHLREQRGCIRPVHQAPFPLPGSLPIAGWAAKSKAITRLAVVSQCMPLTLCDTGMSSHTCRCPVTHADVQSHMQMSSHTCRCPVTHADACSHTCRCPVTHACQHAHGMDPDGWSTPSQACQDQCSGINLFICMHNVRKEAAVHADANEVEPSDMVMASQCQHLATTSALARSHHSGSNRHNRKQRLPINRPLKSRPNKVHSSSSKQSVSKPIQERPRARTAGLSQNHTLIKPQVTYCGKPGVTQLVSHTGVTKL
jgi:hypothetical protein